MLLANAEAYRLRLKDSEYEDGSQALQTETEDLAKQKMTMDSIIKKQGELMTQDEKLINDYHVKLD